MVQETLQSWITYCLSQQYSIKSSAPPCQHMAGSSVVEKIIGSLTDVADHYNVVVDLLGFDGWTAAFSLNEISKGNMWATGTVCHCLHETSFVAEITSNKIFSLGREGALVFCIIFTKKVSNAPQHERDITTLYVWSRK